MSEKYVTRKELMSEIKELKQAMLSMQQAMVDAINKLGNTKNKESIDKSTNDNRKYATFSLYIDKKDYDLLNKVAKANNLSVSKFIKERYWIDFMSSGPEDYKAYKSNSALLEGQIDLCRKRSGANKSIALALSYSENLDFNDSLNKWGLSTSDKRDILKFFVLKFLLNQFNMKQIGLKWIVCKSSHIDSYAYDKQKKDLYMMFRNGSIYKYLNVPENIYEGLNKADSKGVYHNKHFLGSNGFECEKIK